MLYMKHVTHALNLDSQPALKLASVACLLVRLRGGTSPKHVRAMPKCTDILMTSMINRWNSA